VLVYEFIYGHPRVCYVTSMKILLAMSRGKDISTVEIVISSRSRLMFSKS
jgi:hypothetical protein